MKKLNLEAFKALQVTATEKIEGGLKVTGSGKIAFEAPSRVKFNRA